MRIPLLPVLPLLAALAAAPVLAGDPAYLRAHPEATESGTGGDAAAFEAARDALIRTAARIPFGFRKALFVQGAPQGFGIYRPRRDTVFATDEPLIAYVEPIGVAWTQADGANHAEFVVDFELQLPDGRIAAGQRGFGNFKFRSQERNLEIFAHLTLNLTGAPAGRYLLRYTFHDKVSGEDASVELPFEVR
ncbi:hypothetical protein SAMN06265365_11337 [Tistlia consotensis]|uniref:Uncharacterized protein n=1 Tax=Tistlia consotensis USBA 355 TaxID=560819 RepID=A0A1Y6C281_9PROT|nr:hypothetical protein [Tistlia consotensis]SMF41595.1 hypothetical protein SAMN05428998_114108 [Tistlia consotensis USBA 355]SNR73593.1 hypothetical protein SAMN06265365_11337 [Tistlia consotensis]